MFCIALRRGEVYRGELCLVGVRQVWRVTLGCVRLRLGGLH